MNDKQTASQLRADLEAKLEEATATYEQALEEVRSARLGETTEKIAKMNEAGETVSSLREQIKALPSAPARKSFWRWFLLGSVLGSVSS